MFVSKRIVYIECEDMFMLVIEECGNKYCQMWYQSVCINSYYDQRQFKAGTKERVFY